MPSSEGENYSTNKRKSMMVLRAYRSALALAGVSAKAREDALAYVAPTWAQCAEDRVGELTAAEPWCFRERATPGQGALYMTPVLRNVLHQAFGGASGDERPPAVFRDVAVGDLVTLLALVVDGVPELDNLIEVRGAAPPLNPPAAGRGQEGDSGSRTIRAGC
jgi:hypothetical protein